jgi:hypothetical protein
VSAGVAGNKILRVYNDSEVRITGISGGVVLNIDRSAVDAPEE